MVIASKGLVRAEEVYHNRSQRAKELKQEGKRIIGYLCYFAPPELITAAGLVPYRTTGDLREPITRADAYYESTMCPYVRNCFDQALKGAGDFLNGFVTSHTCDSILKVSGLWAYYLQPPYFRVVNVPHNLSQSSLRFFKTELLFFKESLDRFAGQEISTQRLREVIRLYNENRALVRGLYDLRKQDPPPMSGAEMMRLLVAGGCLPADEFNDLLKEVTQGVEGRSGGGEKKPRILVYGSIMDFDTFIKLIEDSGANVVVDDVCIGTRIYAHDVPDTADPFDGLVKCYLEDFVCPRTGRPSDNARFDYIKDYIRDFKVNGVLLYALNFCDPHKFDIPSLRDYLAQDGLPTLYIEDDYTMANIQAIKTRVQAFVEMIG